MNPKKIHESMQKKLKNGPPDEENPMIDHPIAFKIGYILGAVLIFFASWLLWNHFIWKFGLPTLNLGQFFAFIWTIAYIARSIRGFER